MVLALLEILLFIVRPTNGYESRPRDLRLPWAPWTCGLGTEVVLDLLLSSAYAEDACSQQCGAEDGCEDDAHNNAHALAACVSLCGVETIAMTGESGTVGSRIWCFQKFNIERLRLCQASILGGSRHGALYDLW